jgi:hypothetical protein
VHRRGLDLEEAGVVEDRAEAADDVAAGAEDVGDGGVGDEVDVALAVARLDVAEAVPLLRQRAVRLGEEAKVGRRDRELAALRRREAPLRLDDVADVDVGEVLVGGPHRRLIHEELDLAGAVAQADEGEAARRPEGHDAARDVDGAP